MTELTTDAVVTLSPHQAGYTIDRHGPFVVVDLRHLSDGSRLILLHTGKPPCWLYGQQRREVLRIIDLRLTRGMDGRVVRQELKARLQNLEGAIYE